MAFYPHTAGEGLLEYTGRPLNVEGTIEEEPLHYDDHSAYVLRVETVQLPEGRRGLSGKLLVKIYGDARDFYRFGYAFYLRSQGIDGLLYPNPLQVRSLGEGGD